MAQAGGLSFSNDTASGAAQQGPAIGALFTAANACIRWYAHAKTICSPVEPSSQNAVKQQKKCLAGLGAADAMKVEGITPLARDFQTDVWIWDVFVCHAGVDKPFAVALSKRLPANLRCFVDEKSLIVGKHASMSMEDAIKSTQIAVVLLSRAFFSSEDPKKELQWILHNYMEGRTTLVPVFLGLTVEKCLELARETGQGLEKVCEVAGLRHMSERRTLDGRTVTREDTMHDIVDKVCALTGVYYPLLAHKVLFSSMRQILQ